MTAHLAFTDVCHAYDRTPVLQGVSFEVEPGTIACLLGASGCGKTTVLRCIAGFEPVLSGTVALDGVVMSTKNIVVPPEQRRIGVVFQDYALFPHLTIAGNIAFGLRGATANERDARVGELLQVVGLTGLGPNIRRNCPAASSSASPSPARWRLARNCCCLTSPSPTSTWTCANG